MAESIHAITMPRWGMTMTEGTIAGWLVPEGGAVSPGQEVIEIETTKITNVMEAAAGGVLRRRVVGEGTTAPVGALLGVLAGPEVDEGEIDRFVAAYRQDEGEIAAHQQAGPAPRLVAGLNVLTVGEGAATPAVLLHGFGGDINAWSFNQDALADGRRVHAIDLPAHGGSGPDVAAGAIENLAGAVLATLREMGESRVHLVGHSLGGAVALALAARAPELVASLALIAPVGLGEEIDASYVEGFLTAERRKAMKEVLAKLYADPERISNDMVEGVLRFKRLDGVPEALRAIAEGFVRSGRQSLDLRAELAAVDGPRLLVWGDKDSIIPAGHGRNAPEEVEVALVPGAAHMPQVEEAAAVNRRLAAHFARAER